MSTDERREQLLATGIELLGQRPHDEVSIDEIAAAAGVSKGLLYHYFPTKRDFVLAVLERGIEEVAARTAPDPSLPAEEQIASALDAFLDYVEEHAAAYSLIFRNRGGGDAEISALLEGGRQRRLEAMTRALQALEDSSGRRLAADLPAPVLETVVQGWFFFVEGAALRWLERRDIERDRLGELLQSTLLSSLRAAASGADVPDAGLGAA